MDYDSFYNATASALLGARSGFEIGYSQGLGVADRFIFPEDVGPFEDDGELTPLFNVQRNSYSTNDWLGLAVVGVCLYLVLKG